MRLQQYINESQSRYKDIIAILKKDCIPFLKELKQTKTKQFLYRGHNFAFGTITKKKVQTDRTPRNTEEITSKYLDELFKKKFGWRARSAGVFTTSNKNQTSVYGKPFFFFPIGKYKYVWSPKVDDLFLKVDDLELNLDFIEEMFFQEYQIKGQDGIWMYDGIEADGNTRLEAKNFVLNNGDEFGIQDSKNFQDNLLKWVPYLTLEEFIEKNKKIIKKGLKDLVSLYINKDLKRAIKYQNEITFNCKEYYLVDLEKPDLEEILLYEFL